MPNSYMVTGTVIIKVGDQKIKQLTQTEVQAVSSDDALVGALELHTKTPFLTVAWEETPIVRETPTLRSYTLAGKDISMKAFLGGTAGNNPWRDAFVADLVGRGIEEEAFFNPVVSDWNEAARVREEEAKEEATHHVYYLADPMQEGNPLSAFSMVEATMALCDRPQTTVVIFDTTGMEGHPLKAMEQTAKVLKERHPNANIFTSAEAAKDWLADQWVVDF